MVERVITVMKVVPTLLMLSTTLFAQVASGNISWANAKSVTDTAELSKPPCSCVLPCVKQEVDRQGYSARTSFVGFIIAFWFVCCYVL